QAMPSNHSPSVSNERRGRPRLAVHWPLVLYREDDPYPLRSVTVNLSSSGFFCRVPIPLRTGELLDCTLSIPAQHDATQMALECKALIVRLESLDSGYGIACHIQQYRIVPAHRQVRDVPATAHDSWRNAQVL